MSNSNKNKKEVIEVPGWEYYDARYARPMWFPVNYIISYFS